MDIAGYEIVGRVASGSTGVVWQARHRELGRLVAIKELAPRLRATPGFPERFREEARILAGLSDPHIVRVLDYVEDDAGAYLIQEWVDGATLTELLARHGALQPEQALGVLRGALSGLAHAHGRGVVHGDLSPGNILVDASGTSKLVDFGLSVPAGGGSGGGSVGTPAFASPEAVAGARLIPASDVYAAAAVLVLLLTGRPPYVGDVATVLAAHRDAPVPVVAGHGPELADLVRRSMAKRPDERPPDAAAFLAELESAAERHYGAGWLGRASVAGIVGTVGTATAAAVAGSGAVAAVPTVVAAGQAVTGSVVGAATRVGPRILGLPVAAAGIAAVVVVAVIAAVTFAVTRPAASDTDDAAAREPVVTAVVEEVADTGAPTTSPASSSAAPVSVPAFSGTYAVVVTLVSVNGEAYDDGTAEVPQEVTWTVTPTCDVGVCDVDVVSSSGNTFSYRNAGGRWIRSGFDDVRDCVDENGVPVGTSVTSTGVGELRPDRPWSPRQTEPTLALAGQNIETVAAPGCGSGAVVWTYSVEATRTGD